MRFCRKPELISEVCRINLIVENCPCIVTNQAQEKQNMDVFISPPHSRCCSSENVLCDVAQAYCHRGVWKGSVFTEGEHLLFRASFCCFSDYQCGFSVPLAIPGRKYLLEN